LRIEIGIPDVSLRIKYFVVRRRVRPRQFVNRVKDLCGFAFRTWQGLQREFKRVGRAEVDRTEVFPKVNLPRRRWSQRSLGRTHPRMQDRRVVRMPGHPLDNGGQLISVETREQDSLLLVAVDTSADLEFLF